MKLPGEQPGLEENVTPKGESIEFAEDALETESIELSPEKTAKIDEILKGRKIEELSSGELAEIDKIIKEE